MDLLLVWSYSPLSHSASTPLSPPAPPEQYNQLARLRTTPTPTPPHHLSFIAVAIF